MNWNIVFGFIGVVVLLGTAFAVGFYFEDLGALTWNRVTGAAIVDLEGNTTNATRHYSWTTALCGLDRRCMDVQVECNGSQIMNVTPVSNLVWHTEEWEDPRGGNPEKLCQ